MCRHPTRTHPRTFWSLVVLVSCTCGEVESRSTGEEECRLFQTCSGSQSYRTRWRVRACVLLCYCTCLSDFLFVIHFSVRFRSSCPPSLRSVSACLFVHAASLMFTYFNCYCFALLLLFLCAFLALTGFCLCRPTGCLSCSQRLTCCDSVGQQISTIQHRQL